MKNPPEFELYDLKNDPYEWNNLAENPEFEDILSNFRKVLYNWQVKTKDPLIDKKIAERLFTDIMKTGIQKVDIPYQNYMDPKCIQERFDGLSNRHLACLQAGRLLDSSTNRQNIFECT